MERLKFEIGGVSGELLRMDKVGITSWHVHEIRKCWDNDLQEEYIQTYFFGQLLLQQGRWVMYSNADQDVAQRIQGDLGRIVEARYKYEANNR